MHSLQGSMLHICIVALAWRHLWRHKGHSFSSITPDQIELASRESHQWTQEDLPNRMICDMTSFDQLRDLGVLTWPWPEVNTLSWPDPNKKYITRCAWASWTRWCQNRGSTAIFGEVIYQKPNPCLRSLDLTSEVTGWPETFTVGSYQSLCIILCRKRPLYRLILV